MTATSQASASQSGRDLLGKLNFIPFLEELYKYPFNKPIQIKLLQYYSTPHRLQASIAQMIAAKKLTPPIQK